MEAFEQLHPNIPWQRLTTPYGRGTDIPRLIETGQFESLAELAEHQGTLWQVTPWVLLELLRGLELRGPKEAASGEIRVCLNVASALSDQDLGLEHPVTSMNELLNEKYLWPEDEEEDELEWERGEPTGYDPEAFFSYYYYSDFLLKQARPLFEDIMRVNSDLAPEVLELLELLK